MTPQETIVQIFEERLEKLGDPQFVSSSDLVLAGIYGSDGAVRKALNRGVFPFLKVSKNRTLIPKVSVIEYLRKACHEQG